MDLHAVVSQRLEDVSDISRDFGSLFQSVDDLFTFDHLDWILYRIEKVKDAGFVEAVHFFFRADDFFAQVQ